MGPTSTPDSYLSPPLNQILGYPGNIQLLRTLIDTRRGLSTTEISERTGLSVPGVHKVISRLLETGVVQREGGGKASKVFIREVHPLTHILTELF
jgi:predicted transcriptional regulator